MGQLYQLSRLQGLDRLDGMVGWRKGILDEFPSRTLLQYLVSGENGR